VQDDYARDAAENSLLDLVGLVRRGFVLAIVAGVATAAGAFFLSGLVTPLYSAQATVVTTAQGPNAAQRDFGATLVTAPALAVATYRGAVMSRPVAAAALASLDGRVPTSQEVQALQSRLTVRAEDSHTSAFLRIIVQHPDPQRARDLANAVAAAAVAWDVERATRSLETIIASLSAQMESIDDELAVAAPADVAGLERARTDLSLQLSSARALRTGAVGRIELFDGALMPVRPVSPRPLFSAVVAAFMAVFAVYGLLMLRSALDTRVRGLDDLARITGLPLLATFPRVTGGRRTLPLDAASYLRTSIGFATADIHPKVVLVTSTDEANGKSSVSIALATSFARQHYRTLLVDADLRRPAVGEEFDLDPYQTPTLLDALESGERVQPARVPVANDVGLDILPSFPLTYGAHTSRNPSDALSRSFGDVLARYASEYDVIVIDSAPILPVADALTIAPHVSGVVFAVSVPTAERASVVRALRLLRQLDVRLFGVVATNLGTGRGGTVGYGGYGGGYGAGYGAGSTPVQPPRAAASKPPRPNRARGA
jgi:polysaccharide biosynthesis transport protein